MKKLTEDQIAKIKAVYNNWWFTDVQEWHDEEQELKATLDGEEGAWREKDNAIEEPIRYNHLITLMITTLKSMIRGNKTMIEDEPLEDNSIALMEINEYEEDLETLKQILEGGK